VTARSAVASSSASRRSCGRGTDIWWSTWSLQCGRWGWPQSSSRRISQSGNGNPVRKAQACPGLLPARS
jgi:hypothetical protein